MAKKVDLDDDKAASAELRDAEKLAELNKGKVSESKSDDDDHEIDLDDDHEDPEKPSVDDDKPSRKDKRRERGESFVQRANQEADAARREAQEYRERLARLEGQVSAQQKPKEDTVADKFAAAKKQLRAEEQGIYARYNTAKANKTITQEMIDQLEAELESVQDRRIEIVAEQKYGSTQKAPTADEIIQQVNRQRIAQEHSDVISNQSAFLWAQGRMRMMVAEGHQDNPETVARVMDEARRKFGMRTRQPERANEVQRSRLSGISRGTGGGGDSSPRTITMTQEYRHLADAAYGHIKDKAARYKAWAKGPGKRILERESRE